MSRPVASPSRTTARPAVLIVDDHPANLLALEAILEPLHARVVRAASGAEALRAMTCEDFAVVLMDVCMPMMDGLETTARIHCQERLRHVPVIFITALDRSSQSAAAGYEHGAADYLYKPFDPTVLRAKVSVFLELFRKNHEIALLNRELEQRVAERTHALAVANAELAASLARLHATQEQLIQNAKVAAVGSLVAGLSHELNNPLSIILAGTQTALRRTDAEHPAHATLASVQQAAERCGLLVRSLLDFLRRSPAHREDVTPAGLLERVADLNESRAAGRGVHLRIAPVLPGTRAFVACIAEIESALSNVVANAIDASHEGDIVLLRASPVAREGVQGIEMVVEDEGHGIADEDLPRIFEPFFTTKPVGQGTGIGLSLARQIVDTHGGRFEVESRVGEGTTMRLWLPERRAAITSRPPRVTTGDGSGERRAIQPGETRAARWVGAR